MCSEVLFCFFIFLFNPAKENIHDTTKQMYFLYTVGAVDNSYV